MALELIDFRGKITHETKALLDARARLTGKSEQEILRDYMHEIALREIHAAKLLTARAAGEGIGGAGGGKA